MVKKLLNINERNKKNFAMHNITIGIPKIYDDNLKFLIKKKIIANRSEAIRIAIGEFLHQEYNLNLDLLNSYKKGDEIIWKLLL